MGDFMIGSAPPHDPIDIFVANPSLPLLAGCGPGYHPGSGASHIQRVARILAFGARLEAAPPLLCVFCNSIISTLALSRFRDISISALPIIPGN